MNYGMNSSVGHLSFGHFTKQSSGYAPRPFSDDTASTVDEEVRSLVDEAYKRTEQILLEKREGFEKVAQLLLEKEVINQEQVREILGPRPFEDLEDKATNYYSSFTKDKPEGPDVVDRPPEPAV